MLKDIDFFSSTKNTTPKKKLKYFILILLGMSIVSGLASDMYVAALPELGRYFNISADSVKWTMSLFFIGLAISQLVYGPLSDYIGRKKIMIFGLMLFSIGCIFCMLTNKFYVFLMGRFIQGCGAGATACISKAIIRDSYQGKKLTQVLSYIGMGLAFVPAIAPVIGGYIQQYGGWQCEFLCMFLYAIILLPISVYNIPETNTYKFQFKKTIKEVVVDFHKMLLDPVFLINVLIASFIVSMIYIFYTFTSFYLQNNLYWSEVEYGKISILIAASLFVGRRINIKFTNYFSNNQMILCGSVVSFFGSVVMVILQQTNSNILVTLFLPITIYTIGGGIVFSNTFVGATEKHTNTIGSISSLYGFVQMLTVFVIISSSTLCNLSTIEAVSNLLVLLSTLSVVMILFLVRKNKLTNFGRSNKRSETQVIPPSLVKIKYPASKVVIKNVAASRKIIKDILDKKDPRMLMIVGPCSFHDPIACLEYAKKLKNLADSVSDTIFLVMRVYLEKPRTHLGWKGYLNDPYLDNTHCIQDAFENVRNFMIKLCEMNVPIATEILNPSAYLYFDELLSWSCIGARTSESQFHREITSNLAMPVGFKNSTAGSISAAANGIVCALHKQIYLGINYDGNICVVKSKGNPYAHLILRGGELGPNYTKDHISQAETILSSLKIPKNILIDCSHGNSDKNHKRQEVVFNDVISQKISGGDSIVGVLLESFLEAGNQPISNDISKLKYGCSITDACLDWEATENLIIGAHQRLNNSSSIISLVKEAI